MKDKYSWDWFRSEMVTRMMEKEKAVSEELNIVQVIDRLAQTTLAHESSPFSNRPQDFLSCSMLAYSFRMMISSCAQILLGYSDTHHSLSRSIWELGVRLFFIKEKDPVGGALGLLIDDSERELNILDAEKIYREQQDMTLGKLQERIDSVRNSLDKHRAKATAIGLDPNGLVSRYARVGTGSICDQLGIRKAYDVSFAFMSGYVHARFSAVEDAVIRNSERAFWLLGPLSNELDLEIRAQLLDLFQDHLLVNVAAAQLLENAELEREVASVLEEVKNKLNFQ